MKQILLCVVFTVLIVAITAAPPTPKWPQTYSTGFDTMLHRSHHNIVGRWFFDAHAKKERVDVSGQWGWDVRIIRYDLGKAFDIRHLGEHEFTCDETDVEGDMKIPDFTDFTYRGAENVEGEPCNHWQRVENGSTYDYFDRNVTADPVQFVQRGAIEDMTTLFFDFDAGTQDPTLFDVQYQFPAITCHPRSKRIHRRLNLAQNILQHFTRDVSAKFNHQLKRLIALAPDADLDYETMTAAPVRTVLDGQASWYCCNSAGESGCGCGKSPNGACGPCGTSDYIAATRWGPCGMTCTVTAKNSGRSVTVRRGDYGPAEWTGRIIDMNCAPAQALDMISAGVIPVHVSCNAI